MPPNADTLTLVQWLSPAFPVGSYAYSQGLEQAITDGHVTDPASLSDWITAVLTQGSARNDAILLAHARHTDNLADLAYALAPSAERATEMREQGAAFNSVLTAMGHPQPALPYALAIGHACRALNLSTADILAHFLQALTAQLISTAVRFVPLGAADGQRVLANLTPLIPQLAAHFATQPLENLTSATLGADIASMRHETLPVRIYRS